MPRSPPAASGRAIRTSAASEQAGRLSFLLSRSCHEGGATGSASAGRPAQALAEPVAPHAGTDLRNLGSREPSPMQNAVIYTKSWCGYCTRAKALLARKGVPFTEIEISNDDALRDEMIA